MLLGCGGSIDWRGLGLCVYGRLAAEHVLAVVDETEQIAGLGLAPPPCEVVTADFSAWIDVGTFSDGHVGRRRYKCHRWLSRIVAWDPVGDGNVVGGVAEVDGDGSFQSEQQLCASIVEGKHLGLGRQRRDGDQCAVHISEDAIALVVRAEHGAEPSLHHAVVHDGHESALPMLRRCRACTDRGKRVDGRRMQRE